MTCQRAKKNPDYKVWVLRVKLPSEAVYTAVFFKPSQCLRGRFREEWRRKPSREFQYSCCAPNYAILTNYTYIINKWGGLSFFLYYIEPFRYMLLFTQHPRIEVHHELPVYVYTSHLLWPFLYGACKEISHQMKNQDTRATGAITSKDSIKKS